jgi:1,4-alpha-glucan branching enzyme
MAKSDKIKIVLALHAHLPYVRIPEKRFPLQELWLFQALTECYIPLILCFRSLLEENINFKITLSISPTLISMLSDDYYKSKYEDYLRTSMELLRRKVSGAGNDLKNPICSLLNRLQTISNFYIESKRDIINELKTISQSGNITLITTSATHAILPLLRFSDKLIKTQIETAFKTFKNAFGYLPDGFWLPEMGYFSGLDKILTDFNIKYTFLDAHSIYLTDTKPTYGNYHPSITKTGLKIFPRDLPLSNTIWSAKTGYPGDPQYREFHYDYTYSLNNQDLAEFDIDKIPFGLKIYKITGNDRPKEFYNHEEAMCIVNIHSDDFIKKINERASLLKQHLKKNAVFTLPFDAELFGHWWYEGPEFLKQIIKKIAASKEIEFLSPAEFEDSNLETVDPAESSWGSEGFFKSWTNPECAWIYPDLAHIDARYNNIEDSYPEAVRHIMKEIMLASASDWTFFIANDTSGDYAKQRISEHINAAKKILSEIETGKPDVNFILKRDELYPLFM